jgi:hypothetical protein
MSNLKDVRVRGIIQKHVDALSREIARELMQPLFEQWGLSEEDAATIVAVPPAPANLPEPVVAKAPIYDKRSRQWVCPHCKRFSGLNRRSVTTHARFCTAMEPARVPEPKARKARRQSKKKP